MWRVAVVEHQLDLLLLRGRSTSRPRSREVDRRLIRLRVVGEEDVAPAAARLDVAHVKDAVGEVREEDARLDVALGAATRSTLKRDFAERLVGVRQRRRSSRRRSRRTPATASSAIGRRMRNTLTPHACSATNSRSADSRPRPNRMPNSSAIGIVTQSACGHERPQRVQDRSSRRRLSRSAARRCWRIGGIISAKVRPTSAISQRRHDLANQIAVENLRHRRSSRLHTYDPGRPPLAHAPAVLRGPRHARAHPAVGAAARAEGLLRHGGAAARVSRRRR